MQERFELLGQIVNTTLLLVISVCGFLINYGIVHTYVFSEKARYSRRINQLTFPFTLASVFNSLLYLCLSCASAAYGDWLWGHTACVTYGYLSTWFDLIENYSLFAMAIMRYVAVNGVIELRDVTPRMMSMITHTVWCTTAIFAALPIFGFSRYEVDVSRFSCTIDWKDIKSKKEIDFILVSFFITTFVPLIGLVFLAGYLIWCTKHTWPTERIYDCSWFFSWMLFLTVIFNLIHRIPYAFLTTIAAYYKIKLSITLVTSLTIWQRMIILWNPILMWRNNEKFVYHWAGTFIFGCLWPFKTKNTLSIVYWLQSHISEDVYTHRAGLYELPPQSPAYETHEVEVKFPSTLPIGDIEPGCRTETRFTNVVTAAERAALSKSNKLPNKDYCKYFYEFFEMGGEQCVALQLGRPPSKVYAYSRHGKNCQYIDFEAYRYNGPRLDVYSNDKKGVSKKLAPIQMIKKTRVRNPDDSQSQNEQQGTVEAAAKDSVQDQSSSIVEKPSAFEVFGEQSTSMTSQKGEEGLTEKALSLSNIPHSRRGGSPCRFIDETDCESSVRETRL